MSYAVRKDGLGWRAVNSSLDILEDEVFSEKIPEINSIFLKEQEERTWRDGELSRADIELNKVQDSDPNATGAVGDWRTYRKELRAWPESPDFPDSAKRPIAPDNSVE